MHIYIPWWIFGAIGFTLLGAIIMFFAIAFWISSSWYR